MACEIGSVTSEPWLHAFDVPLNGNNSLLQPARSVGCYLSSRAGG
jgi:hypothetical protein